MFHLRHSEQLAPQGAMKQPGKIMEKEKAVARYLGNQSSRQNAARVDKCGLACTKIALNGAPYLVAAPCGFNPDEYGMPEEKHLPSIVFEPEGFLSLHPTVAALITRRDTSNSGHLNVSAPEDRLFCPPRTAPSCHDRPTRNAATGQISKVGHDSGTAGQSLESSWPTAWRLSPGVFLIFAVKPWKNFILIAIGKLQATTTCQGPQMREVGAVQVCLGDRKLICEWPMKRFHINRSPKICAHR
ncbi:predicted protein [Histoplasma mississippiense (nom. inval.)]|uniref:predicted protein n=1 Tax=Ajellomyces capsulatus (strain NAm1 / WU24) TaxID=2059318 RepID=UPI000157C8F7|nr:predicted protein [Histoplasma mississippiense (nom. inval.)]EDN09232.1 predicted protein [Histoplasma mississippiense (nom. inval.)]